MGDTSDIEWTDATWNPVRGCSRISPGCENCYAERVAARFSGPGKPYHGFAVMGDHGAKWTRKVALVPKHLPDPLRWRAARMIFVNSMSDLFHEGFSNQEIAAVFAVMAAAPRHTFQVLTKRAARMAAWFAWAAEQAPAAEFGRAMAEIGGLHLDRAAASAKSDRDTADLVRAADWLWHAKDTMPKEAVLPLRNVWMGVSVEDQARADERLPLLAHVPAAKRMVSYEPALGPVDLHIDMEATTNRYGLFSCPRCRGWGVRLLSLVPGVHGGERESGCQHCQESGCAIDWVIVGGESGPGARPFHIGWARSMLAQCKALPVAVFLKQMGSNPWSGDTALVAPFPTTDPKGGNPDEWPEDLRVRDYPEALA